MHRFIFPKTSLIDALDMTAAYPAIRLRRPRAHAWSRALHAELRLSPADFLWPLFVTGGESTRAPVSSMPGVERLYVVLLAGSPKEHAPPGIPPLPMFPT